MKVKGTLQDADAEFLQLEGGGKVTGTFVLGWSTEFHLDQGYECYVRGMSERRDEDSDTFSQVGGTADSKDHGVEQQQEHVAPRKRRFSFRKSFKPLKKRFQGNGHKPSNDEKDVEGSKRFFNKEDKTAIEAENVLTESREHPSAIEESNGRLSVLPFLVRVHSTQEMAESDAHYSLKNNGNFPEVECILPSVLVADPNFDAASNTSLDGTYDGNFVSHPESTDLPSLVDDDPWAAAKRGDLRALKQFAENLEEPVDWTAEDEFNGTPLYYACHSGAAAGEDGMASVRFLLNEWPGKMPPPKLLDRCRKNAISKDVLQLLEPGCNQDVINKSTSNIFDHSDDEGRGALFSLFAFDEEAADY